MTWWDCGGGGVLELAGLGLELELRFDGYGRTVAWWVDSQTGAWLRPALVGRA
jgi:hypothetical protein